MVIAGHKQVAVEYSVEEFQEHCRSYPESAVFFQTAEIQGNYRYLRIIPDNCLTQKMYIIRCTAAAACLGYEQGSLVRVVLAACKSVHELTDYQKCRVAGIIVYIFQTLVNYAAAVVTQQLHFVSGSAKDADEQFEVDRQHIRNKDSMGLYHILGELCIFRHF